MGRNAQDARRDVDASGIRIAARRRSAYDLALRRIITRAQLVYPEAGETDADLLTTGRADALASLRDVLPIGGQFAPRGADVGVA